SGVDGTKEVSLTARESLGTAMVEIAFGANPDKVLADVRSAVDGIKSFPKDAERAVVTLMSARSEVVSLVLHGAVDDAILRHYGAAAREELLRDPAIDRVELVGAKPREISIEIAPSFLRGYNLTLADVAARIRGAWAEIPAGDVRTGAKDLNILTDEPLPVESLAHVPVARNQSGSLVRLGSISRIADGFADTGESAVFNGESAVMLRVFRTGNQTPLTVAEAVERHAERLKQELPSTIQATVWNDFSELYAQRVNLVLRNAWMGLLLVFVVLGLFLEPRLALWVTVGIPASFLGSLLVMPALGGSINMISLFAYIITLGVVVDDAIIVGENIYATRDRFSSPLMAAIWGAKQVAVPICFAVLTSVAAFLPLFFVPGVFGKFFRIIPMVVVTVLIISLLESLFILPAHLAPHGNGAPGGSPDRGGWFSWVSVWQKRFAGALHRFIHERYRPLAIKAVQERPVTIALGTACLVVVAGLVGGGRLGFTFFPNIDSDIVVASAKLPVGTPVTETERLQRFVMRSARDVLADQKAQDSLRGMFSHIGQSVANDGISPQGATGTHSVDVMVWLAGADKRPFSSQRFSKLWRERIGDFPGLRSLAFQDAGGPGGGSTVSVQLRHTDSDVLTEAAVDLARRMRDYTGVTNVRDDLSEGKEQMTVKLTDAGKRLGLTPAALGRQVREAFFGAEAFRRQRGRDEVRVMVRLPKYLRESVEDVQGLPVRCGSGKNAGWVPLRHVARMEFGRSGTSIRRKEGYRITTVKADFVPELTSSGKLVAHMRQTAFPRLQEQYPGLSVHMAGQQREQNEAMSSLGFCFLMALLLIYALLAIPFKSYTQPLLVMSLIPFGIVGAALGHLLLGYNLSLMSIMGIVALSGVVVNDSLVLIHAANQARAEGASAQDAVVTAGMKRFRPILLTSLTTFFGLMPMIFETSMQARFLIPMAISIGFGVLFATVISLLLLPAFYVTLEDMLAWLRPPPCHPERRDNDAKDLPA
ncbi:MAG: efflux RND transporter permease subunit, partial [Myxococcota bacterium]